MGHLNRIRSTAVLAILFLMGCSRSPSDALIATQIKAKFFSDPMVKTAPLSVAVNQGVVTLAGTVASVEVELQAFKLAADTQGVRKLNDKMQVAMPQESHRSVGQLAAAGSPQRQLEGAAQRLDRAGNEVAGSPQLDPELREEVQYPPQEETPAPAQTEAVGLVADQGYPVASPQPVPVDAAPATPVPDWQDSRKKKLRSIHTSINPIEAQALTQPETTHAPVVLTAAGGTGPASLIEKWTSRFHQTDPQVQIRYLTDGFGSVGRQSLPPGMDFGVMEALNFDSRWSSLTNPTSRGVLPPTRTAAWISQRGCSQMPAAITGVIPIFNIGADWQVLNFTGEVLGAIFSGKITRWDDPAIQKLNKNVIMPNATITLIHRSDSPDAGILFAEYLRSVSPDWQNRRLPIALSGQGSDGNEGELEMVNRLLFSIGYVDAPFAIQRGLVRAKIQNQAGRFVAASKASLAAAVAGAQKPDSTNARSSLLNSSSDGAYPIASYIWLIVPKSLADANKDAVMSSFVKWVLSDGQSDASESGYAPLPKASSGSEQTLSRRSY